MKYFIFIVAVVLLSGCTSVSLSERLEAGADAGAWSLCNYPYPYVKGRSPGDKCDKLWDKFNNVSEVK